MDCCSLRSNLNYSCLCPDWFRLHLIPGSSRSSPHSGCFFLIRTIFIDSLLHPMFKKHPQIARHFAKGILPHLTWSCQRELSLHSQTKKKAQ